MRYCVEQAAGDGVASTGRAELLVDRPAAGADRHRRGLCLRLPPLGRCTGEAGRERGAQGISDVTVGDRKISGNAQARTGGVLLHGTLLCDADIDLIEACLPHPPREPNTGATAPTVTSSPCSGAWREGFLARHRGLHHCIRGPHSRLRLLPPGPFRRAE